ncbi:MAG: hypothetical protein U9Q68_06370 [Euryarchaeota archaeon]|nr:hypothetical protein [Euryarchaeota archaeon]
MVVGAKNPLSKEFKVAAEIYACNESGELVWYTKLVRRLSGKLSKNTIAHALDTLFDWGIVKAEYGETETGRAGKLLMISNEAKPIVQELYLRYWKDYI